MDRNDQQPARLVQPMLPNETDRTSAISWRVLCSVRQGFVALSSLQNHRHYLLLHARYTFGSIPYLARRTMLDRIMRIVQISIATNSLLQRMFATLGGPIINCRLAWIGDVFAYIACV